jgi:hypothetical protein
LLQIWGGDSGLFLENPTRSLQRVVVVLDMHIAARQSEPAFERLAGAHAQRDGQLTRVQCEQYDIDRGDGASFHVL